VVLPGDKHVLAPRSTRTARPFTLQENNADDKEVKGPQSRTQRAKDGAADGTDPTAAEQSWKSAEADALYRCSLGCVCGLPSR